MNDLLLNNRYRLKQLIGTGGMADVYLAYDIILEREVAIKILHDTLAKDTTFIDNFKREAKSAGKLVHPNIVGIYDVGDDNGKYYIVMEYIKGGHTLKDEMEKNPLSLRDSLSFALDIAKGLKAAHEMGFVHCDIKPQNILLTEDRHAKITDFGIARVTTSASTLVFGRQEIMGTAHYLSPEQAQGSMVDSRSDQYSLGVVLYEMLSGEKVFDGENPVSIAVKHIQEYPLPLSVCCENLPMELCSIVERLLEKNPKDRYHSIDLLIDNLKEIYYSLDSSNENMILATRPINRKDLLLERKKRATLETKDVSFFKKKKSVVALIFLFVISFGAVFFIMSDAGTREIEVPQVEGLPQEEAIKKIEELRLQVEITESIDAQVEPGKVIKQTPIGGTKVKEGRVITLVVAGKEGGKIAVPSLIGLSQKEAETILLKSELSLGRVSVGWDATKPAGTVLKQEIRAGDLVGKKTTIDLIVNPEGTIVLPDLREKTTKEAEQIIKQLGLQAIIQESNSSGKKSGTVVDQNPSPGTSMLNEGQVTLVVSTASEKNSISISYTIPEKQKSAKIRIIKTGNGSEITVFSGTAKSGDTISKTYEVESNERILVYSNDQLVLEK